MRPNLCGFRGKHEQGFTLVEVLVALAIIVIVIQMFTSVFTGGLRTIRGVGAISKSIAEGQECMENAIISLNGQEGVVEVTEPWVVAIQFPDSGAVIETPGWKIDVTVSEDDGSERELTLTTFVAGTSSQ